jgi:hypothetical protein
MVYRDEEVGRKEELRTEAGVILGTKPATPSEFFIAVKGISPCNLMIRYGQKQK